MAALNFRLADFEQAHDREFFLQLLDHYSRDPFGGGEPLPAEIAEVLPQRWADHPGAFTLFAFAEQHQAGELPVGMANCLTSFSTFQAKPRINIHDLVVMATQRGQGIGRKLIAAVRQEALRRGACQVTLEVRADNQRARGLYESCGFSGIQIPPENHSYLFGTIQLSAAE